MNRRSSLKYLAVGGLVTTVAGGSFWLSRDREHAGLALDQVVRNLQALDLEKIDTTGAWGAARTFNHLAQSVEFSIKGYPKMKSQLFRKTVGKLAFSVFQANGRMTHGLNQEIPGESVETNGTSSAQARERLIQALWEFDAFEGALQPHFAYGLLNKSQYALAHAMHVNNHLEEFRVA